MWPLSSPDRKNVPSLLRLSLVALLLGGLWGCAEQSSPFVPDETTSSEAQGKGLNLSTLREAAELSTVRLKVEVQPAGEAWFAKEVKIQSSSELWKMERVTSPVVAVDPVGGTLTVRVGNLAMEAASGARFEASDGSPISREAFFTALRAGLESGSGPGVELLRTPATAPQSPQDRSFVAEVLRLAPGLSYGTVELNVDHRHVAVITGESGTLTLLGLEVGVNLNSGSVMAQESEGGSGGDGESAETIGFGGRVVAVALDEDEDGEAGTTGTFTLINGRVYTVTEDTEFTDESVLQSLTAMAGALAAGDVVTVEGLAFKDPETGAWVVESLTVKTSGNDEGDGGFGGRVIAVALDEDEDGEALTTGTFTLIPGRVYTVTEDTEFTEESVLKSLTAMAGALAAGDVVTVEGLAFKDPETGAWMVESLTARAAGGSGDEGGGPGTVGFGGRVTAVAPDDDDPGIGTFTLINGRVYTVTADTEFDPQGNLTSLEAMAEALAAGRIVTAEGTATQSSESGAWIVEKVRARRQGP